MGPVSTVMSMTGNEKTLARLVWLSALANAILNLILIPIYGVIGAAIATVTAQLVRQVIIVYWSATRLHLHTTILGSMKVTG
jgi:O-antigen/teichoic acid export membrane protein